MDAPERRLNIVERYDWVVWGVLGLTGVMFGVSDMLIGGSTFGSGETSCSRASQGRHGVNSK